MGLTPFELYVFVSLSYGDTTYLCVQHTGDYRPHSYVVIEPHVLFHFIEQNINAGDYFYFDHRFRFVKITTPTLLS